MGAAFSFNMFSASANITTSTIVQNISQSISTSCNNGNITNADMTNVSINITGVTCDDIDVVTQEATTNYSCNDQATLDSSCNTLADYVMANRTQNGGAAAEFGLGTVSANMSRSQMFNQIRTQIKAKCGGDNADSAKIADMSINLKDVSCKDLKVIQQHTSNTSKCYLNETAKAMNSAAETYTGGNATGGDFSWLSLGSMISYVVVVGIIAFAAVQVVKHLREQKLVRCVAAYDRGLPPDATCPANVGCHHASATGAPMPPHCDPKLSQGGQPGIPALTGRPTTIPAAPVPVPLGTAGANSGMETVPLPPPPSGAPMGMAPPPSSAAPRPSDAGIIIGSDV